jgi:nuclear transport factor 2 (NTF2) superfamily protein
MGHTHMMENMSMSFQGYLTGDMTQKSQIFPPGNISIMFMAKGHKKEKKSRLIQDIWTFQGV